jgi:HAE1 family hydrophobic/amphiphilic exporter-1
MGMTVFAGMLVATAVGVLVVPALYVIVERYVTRSDRATAPPPAPGRDG